MIAKRIPALTLLLLSPTPCPTLWALPDTPEVTSGNASVTTSAGRMDILQHSDKAVLEFQQFNIDPHETVQFHQPGRDAIAISRVTGGQASEILGQLQSNGHLFLINPQGILFGPEAKVNVGGLIASTLAIDHMDLAKGLFELGAATTGSHLINQGEIQVRDGSYALMISPEIHNSGSIIAQLGTLHLVSADRVTVQFNTEGLPGIAVQQAALKGLIENQGQIKALGGLIQMTAQGGGALWDTAINNDGLIQADSIQSQDGKIFLAANRIAQNGTLSANGQTGDGGEIQLRADTAIALGNESFMTANAGEQGHGGKITAITPGSALFRKNARIEAKGGAVSGDGGFVEISGHAFVEIQGSVDTSATHGRSGTFLIDPFNVSITNTDNNTTFNGGTYEPTGSSATINANALSANLRSGNVTVTTTGAGTESGDITVESAIDLDGTDGNTLTLQADRNVQIQADIADNDTATPDNTHIALLASGSVMMSDGTSVNAGGGTITATATTGQVFISNLTTTNDTENAISITANGSVEDAGDTHTDLIANAANAQLTIVSNAGGIVGLETEITQADLTANSDQISLTQITGDLSLNRIELNNSTNGINISTTNGTITLTETGSGISFSGSDTLALLAGDSDNSQDHALNINAPITVTGDGNVTLINQLHDINISANGDITTETGNINATTNGGFLSMEDGSVFSSISGSVQLAAAQGMGLGRLQTGSTSDTAIQLSTVGGTGNVFDSGDVSGEDISAPAGGLTILNTISAGGEGNNSIETNVDRLISSSGDVSHVFINETDAIRVQAWTGVSSGSFTLNAGGDIQVRNIIVPDGTVTLISGGRISDPDSDSATDISTGTLSLSARDGIGTLGEETFLGDPTNGTHTFFQFDAANLNLSLSGDAATVALEHASANTLGSLTVNSIATPTDTTETATAALWLVSTRNSIDISGVDMVNAVDSNDTLVLLTTDVDLNNDDNVVLPDMTNAIPGRLRLEAAHTGQGLASASSSDLSNLAISANELLIKTGTAENLLLNAGQLDAYSSSGSFNITAQNALILRDLDNDGFSLGTDNGDIFLTVNNGDLTIENTLHALDGTDDDLRSGLVDINVAAGNIRIGTTDAASIISENRVDQSAVSSLGTSPTGQVGLRIRITDGSTETRTITLGDNSGSDVTLNAIGSDLLIAAGAGAIGTDANIRQLLLNSDVTVSAFNTASDEANGTVTLREVSSTGTVIARAGRAIELSSDNLLVSQDVEQVVDTIIRDVSSSTQPGSTEEITVITEESKPAQASSSESGQAPIEKRNIAAALEQALPPCEPGNESQSGYTCRKQAAIKRFLNSLMLSSELPVIK